MSLLLLSHIKKITTTTYYTLLYTYQLHLMLLYYLKYNLLRSTILLIYLYSVFFRAEASTTTTTLLGIVLVLHILARRPADALPPFEFCPTYLVHILSSCTTYVPIILCTNQMAVPPPSDSCQEQQCVFSLLPPSYNQLHDFMCQ